MKSKVVLLGPPGCGKGTQAEKLGDELGYVKLSTGDMLREAVRNGTELGMKAKTYMDSGALVPNDLIIGLMKEKIAGLDRIILDGFPRTIEQAAALAEQIDIDVAVNIDVDDAELVKRLTQRRSCPDCNATVRNRLEVYRKNTFPLIDYYEKRGKLVTVPGVGSIDEIYAKVRKALE